MARVTARPVLGFVVEAERVMTAARVGPVHGAQPSPKDGPDQGCPQESGLGAHDGAN
ncbi:hypothetical protein N803_05245 [Knoellia subterranea KCTC 19937]|uniref:Uncharacterized protein n=1 Tax=Knoellia subterranea KCTC 19937 TaxID=1385521 RepID=A0A0A0JFR4_9MICO|nr:hypothetical protein N803_05245 [Knoellia subterranea KCTC 19937]